MNAITPTPPGPNVSSPLMPTNLQDAMQLANMMSKGKLVPQALQQSPSDCLMVIEQSMRWGMSPFAVAQEVSVIQGKMMYSGKIVAAAIHTSGVLDGRLSYDYQGTNGDMAVTVTGKLRGETEARQVSVKLKDAKTANQHWAKSPEQMLSYHAARVWARRHAPEVMLGVYAPEEFEPDEPRQERQVQSTVVRPEPAKRAPLTLDEALQGDAIPDFDAPPEDPAMDYAKKLIDRFDACETQDDYNEILGSSAVSKNLHNMQQKRQMLWETVETARKRALDRITAGDPGDAAEPDQAAA